MPEFFLGLLWSGVGWKSSESMKAVVKNVVTTKSGLTYRSHIETQIMWGGGGVISPLYLYKGQFLGVLTRNNNTLQRTRGVTTKMTAK